MTDKNFIRRKNLLLRKELNSKEASDKIVSKILRSSDFLHAKNILIFYPMKYEINLLKLVEVKDKNFYLPRVEGDNLLICPFEGELKKSPFGVYEPVSPSVAPEITDIVYVPCLAIDKNLNRVGYGKGYYDRLFSTPGFKALKIAVIYKEFTHDIIDSDIYDKKVDSCVTD